MGSEEQKKRMREGKTAKEENAQERGQGVCVCVSDEEEEKFLKSSSRQVFMTSCVGL